jgi:hypothetical protein
VSNLFTAVVFAKEKGVVARHLQKDALVDYCRCRSHRLAAGDDHMQLVVSQLDAGGYGSQ